MRSRGSSMTGTLSVTVWRGGGELLLTHKIGNDINRICVPEADASCLDISRSRASTGREPSLHTGTRKHRGCDGADQNLARLAKSNTRIWGRRTTKLNTTTAHHNLILRGKVFINRL